MALSTLVRDLDASHMFMVRDLPNQPGDEPGVRHCFALLAKEMKTGLGPRSARVERTSFRRELATGSAKSLASL